ncbi:MAG: ribonuclease III [Clostridia bacterium]|nr:ribonuclease III [Clostridia bacterium]
MIFNLTEVQRKIGYEFKCPELLRVAFTHASFSNEKKGEKNNERLEFLGDSVLGFIVTDYLFKYTEESEGDMTENKQLIVSFKPLSATCKRLKLYENLIVGENVVVTEKLQENLMEAVIGAIYLDGGIEEAKKFIYNNIINKIKLKADTKFVDYKSKLNELSAKKRFTVSYETVDKKGMDNDPTFTVSLFIDGKKVASSTAKGKKQNAEQLVAKKALEILRNKKLKQNG